MWSSEEYVCWAYLLRQRWRQHSVQAEWRTLSHATRVGTSIFQRDCLWADCILWLGCRPLDIWSSSIGQFWHWKYRGPETHNILHWRGITLLICFYSLRQRNDPRWSLWLWPKVRECQPELQPYGWNQIRSHCIRLLRDVHRSEWQLPATDADNKQLHLDLGIIWRQLIQPLRSWCNWTWVNQLKNFPRYPC